MNTDQMRVTVPAVAVLVTQLAVPDLHATIVVGTGTKIAYASAGRCAAWTCVKGDGSGGHCGSRERCARGERRSIGSGNGGRGFSACRIPPVIMASASRMQASRNNASCCSYVKRIAAEG